MSKKEPIEINIKEEITIQPEGIYLSRVVPSGNGAVINFYKRFLNEEVIVIVAKRIKNKKALTK